MELNNSRTCQWGIFGSKSLPPVQALAVASAAVTAGTTVLNESMQTAPSASQTAPPENLPNAPSSTESSLSDLGVTPQETQGNAKEQALLDKRAAHA